MFRYLYDYSQECGLEDSLVFYFVYYIIGYYLFVSFSALLASTEIIIYILLFFPSVFCALIATLLMNKKTLCDVASYFYLINTITLPFIAYLLLAFSGPMAVYTPFAGLALGLIPVAVLTSKEDKSFDKQWIEIEKERLTHMQSLEKQLQKERAIRLKNEEIKKIITKEHSVAINPIKI